MSPSNSGLLAHIHADIRDAWPKHAPFLAKSLAAHDEAELAGLEKLAGVIDTISGGYASLIPGYRWMCERFLEEELHFRRTGEYRCKTLAEAIEQVYSNKPFMKNYMEGLLISQLLWVNHAKSYLHFANRLMPRMPDGFDYLEIGPGHGLFLSQCALDPRRRSVLGLDVSQESLDQTTECLKRLGVSEGVRLALGDIAATPYPGQFDVITISEVLEHIEQPQLALTHLRSSLRPGGLMFVNFPINSPAPDHIYLLRTPEEVLAMLKEAGFEVLDFAAYPMTGFDLARAIAVQATVSCVAIVTVPAA